MTCDGVLGQELMRETVSKFSVGSFRGKNNLIELNVWKWGIRLFCIYGTIVVVRIFLRGTSNVFDILWALVATVGVVCLLVFSEYLFPSEIRGATPLVVYEGGIRVKRSGLEKALGRSECIPVSAITKVEVIRADARQSGRGLVRDYGGGIWHDSPVLLMIHLRDGSRYRSGAKAPYEVVKIIRAIREHWGVPVIDRGEGPGWFEPMGTKRKR